MVPEYDEGPQTLSEALPALPPAPELPEPEAWEPETLHQWQQQLDSQEWRSPAALPPPAHLETAIWEPPPPVPWNPGPAWTPAPLPQFHRKLSAAGRAALTRWRKVQRLERDLDAAREAYRQALADMPTGDSSAFYLATQVDRDKADGAITGTVLALPPGSTS